jgi:hypothetical protein
MQYPKALTYSIATSLAAISFGMANGAIAQTIRTRGPHGAAVISVMDANFPKMATKHKMTVTPYNLVFLAYQGFLSSEGIPSAMGLIRAYRQQEISAQELTQAAVKMNRLPATALQDKGFLADVKTQLDNLIHNDN